MQKKSTVHLCEILLKRFARFEQSTYTQEELSADEISILSPQSFQSLQPSARPTDESRFEMALMSARDTYSRNASHEFRSSPVRAPLHDCTDSGRRYSPVEWAHQFRDALDWIGEAAATSIILDGDACVYPPAVAEDSDCSRDPFMFGLMRGQTKTCEDRPYLLWRAIPHAVLRSGESRGCLIADCAVDDVAEGCFLRSELVSGIFLLCSELGKHHFRRVPSPVTVFTFTHTIVRILQLSFSLPDDPGCTTPTLNLCLQLQIPFADLIGDTHAADKNWRSLVRWTMFRGPKATLETADETGSLSPERVVGLPKGKIRLVSCGSERLFSGSVPAGSSGTPSESPLSDRSL